MAEPSLRAGTRACSPGSPSLGSPWGSGHRAAVSTGASPTIWQNSAQPPSGPNPDASWNQPLSALVAQMVKNLPAMWETRVRSLGREDPLEGNDNPLQCSCLENPMDREAWRAADLRVAQSQTRLKQLSMHAHSVQKGFLSNFQIISNPWFKIS